jgi:hypothetical protein
MKTEEEVMSLRRSSILALAASAIAAAGHATSPPSPAAEPTSSHYAAKPISEDDLQALSGGQAVNINEQQLKSITSDNSVNALGSVNNGPVTVSPGAFSGYSGLGNFVINTGNNNTLQGSMSVNIMLAPSP